MAMSKPERFARDLAAAGAELLAPTNPFEVMRFRTRYGTGIIYRNKQARENWNEAAILARDHLAAQKGSLAPVRVFGRRRKSAGTVRALMDRDGGTCFYCRHPLLDDVSIEHLVAVAQGGPNHISNLFLAHAQCNQRAGHLSAPEKISMRDNWIFITPSPVSPDAAGATSPAPTDVPTSGSTATGIVGAGAREDAL